MAGETLIGSIDFGGGRALEVVPHDLLSEKADGSVNAANGGLSHGGGVTAAIARAASLELDEVLSTAGQLPFKGAIHTLGSRQGQARRRRNLPRRC